MLERLKAFVEKHPIGVSVGAAGIAAAYFYLHSSNSGDSGLSSADYAASQQSDVAAATALQQTQLQANQAALQSNNQTAVANNQITGQEVIAQLQSQDTLANISATATTQQNADILSAQTTQAVSALQAQVAENQTAAQVATAQINANAYVNIADAPYQSADYIAALNEKFAETGAATTIASLTAQLGQSQSYATQLSAYYTGELQTITDYSNQHPTSPFGAELPGVTQAYTNANILPTSTSAPTPIHVVF